VALDVAGRQPTRVEREDLVVAVGTGASRGLGKGIALGLGEAGAIVYVTGRSTSTRGGSLPGTIEETAAEVTRRGGQGIAVRCDHRVDSEVETLFGRVRREQDHLDLLVNNAMASPEQRLLWGGQRFWEIPITLWDDLIDVGLRSHFVASRYAVPIMIEQGGGVVINVASHAAGGSGKSASSRVILPYSVCKAGLPRETAALHRSSRRGLRRERRRARQIRRGAHHRRPRPRARYRRAGKPLRRPRTEATSKPIYPDNGTPSEARRLPRPPPNVSLEPRRLE
jgi:NAD(P)-dependent dehydrogenase (short-subunit alcohol dehydrogenase family)